MKKTIEEYIKNHFSFADEYTKERLIKTALKSLKEETEKLKDILENGEVKDILDTVHKLKGILLTCGLEEISKEFEEIRLKEMELLELKKSLKESLEKITLK